MAAAAVVVADLASLEGVVRQGSVVGVGVVARGSQSASCGVSAHCLWAGVWVNVCACIVYIDESCSGRPSRLLWTVECVQGVCVRKQICVLT